MVYTNRTEKCLTSQEPNAAKSSSSSAKSSFGAHSSSSSNSAHAAATANNSWSKNASDSDKWKYNNMVRNERDKFNSMHFC